MYQRLIFLLILTLLALAGICQISAQQNQPRVALVMGNASYPDASTPLSTATKDARTLADEFRRSEFDVDLKENVGKEAMQGAIDAFIDKIRSGDAALFYFSGYGIQVARQTYLLPVNAQVSTEADVRRDGISVDALLAQMHRKGAKVKIIILDASRGNPFERRFRASTAGLAALDAPDGTLAMYSAAPGKVMNESSGTNSLFVGELIKELRVPNLTAEEVFNRVRIRVSRASNNEQVPWVASSLVDEFYFGSPRPAATTPSAAPAVEASRPAAAPSPSPAPRDPMADAQAGYQSAERAGTKSAWEDFLAKYPSGRYADRARDQVARISAAASPKGEVSDPFEQLRLTTEKYLKSVPARYNVPEYLTYGLSKEISFVLEPQGVGTGADRLTNMPGEVVTAIVQVSPQVKALLTGPADSVEIKLRGGEDAQRKAVTLSTPVQWVWDVKAIGVGTAVLQLELISFIPSNEKDTSLQVSTFRRQIPIEISGLDQAKRFVAEISSLWAFLAAVATALGGTLAFVGWRPTFGRLQRKDDS
jgi:uncharacterized caspase-like protein